VIIKRIAVGNSEESFIEDSLTGNFNIISSDDNNKGKTIIIQSLMYALGNEPTFPSSFFYKKYFHFVEFEIQKNTYKICRKSNGFVLKTPSELMIFDNVSELKRYWNKHIFKLPHIYKKERLRIVDPVLFLQLFFVGQDKKETFNVSSSGFYNKNDFINMLFSFCNLGSQHQDQEDIVIAKKRISDLKEERKNLLKQNKILKSNKTAVNYLSSISDKESFGEKIKLMDNISDKIAELRKERNASATRKIRWETTIKELRSLNRTLDGGELKCMDCNSTNISFSTAKRGSFNFDVSSVEMRNEIIHSINEKIDSYEEEIQKLTVLINKEQERLQKMMTDDDISLETIVIYKSQTADVSDVESKIREIDAQLDSLKDQIRLYEITSEKQKEQQTKLLESITLLIRETYTTIDHSSNAIIEGLFTKRDEVLSGSEATIFHLAKLYALQKCTNHTFPIIVDSFRAEDLSTNKENKVLDLYKKLPNQKIFTTTLKFEEMNKYDDISFINSIDYTDHTPSKILSKICNDEFKKMLLDLSIKIN
jgi:hypothetical protein